ncbi:hypothetical protein ASPZODRAFT_70237 [Penicilliopsis zonata CBS 506.65]|uniref:BHLH domain-containing protein n=1 Tax=Penicilliopsis zonata CBS 506.65 TaxID=1073090 RepID=A0A1L9SCQ0_9EURO|nr:hypothetical protein ASPZODRAFT_70237 [Penicilliopsis zonata CBS 506.65]OJJ44867.1 hypothetical protein ASPZODRAFT_70237 [Penicilliopsis zonata CBS 506.65]
MDQGGSLPWPEQLHEQSLIPGPSDEDFTHFLEFGMNFADIEGHERQQRSLPNAAVTMPTTTAEELVRMETVPTSHPSPFGQMMGGLSLEMQQRAAHSQPQQAQMHPAYSNPGMTPGFYAQEPPPHSHPPSQQQHYASGQTIIPPTPNSIELHGGAARFTQRVEESQDMYDRYAHINEEQALYTPLISPAMTPLETQFRLPEYTIPGEYFTPLTSPALEAQNPGANGYPFARQVSDVGFVPSPVDVNPIPVSSAPSSPGILRKHRRQPSTNKRLTNRGAKQSPLVRPQSRKKSLLNINEDILGGLVQEPGSSRIAANSGSSLRYGSNESSGQDSVSPEPLSEPLMPPPALPQSRPSPAIVPQTAATRSNEAATPATLMRIQRTPLVQSSPTQFSGQAGLISEETHDDIMEDIVLPEAATPAIQPRPKLARIETTMATESASPIISASVTPSIESRSGFVGDRTPGSVAPSPRTLAMPSPSGPVAKKSDSLKPGMSRKRQSMSSSQMSPPLRPKISPSIQPSVRGDGITSEASALYLASKSNYQHILDGTLLPGVSYPDTLAENLSSKRTNHKLAEQGRRNRINNALKEIEALLPPGFATSRSAKESGSCTPKAEKDKEKEKSSNQAISKASTVEMAIDYIKALKQELDEAREKLKVAEAQLQNQPQKSSTPAQADSDTANNQANLEVSMQNATY